MSVCEDTGGRVKVKTVSVWEGKGKESECV